MLCTVRIGCFAAQIWHTVLCKNRFRCVPIERKNSSKLNIMPFELLINNIAGLIYFLVISGFTFYFRLSHYNSREWHSGRATVWSVATNFERWDAYSFLPRTEKWMLLCKMQSHDRVTQYSSSFYFYSAVWAYCSDTVGLRKASCDTVTTSHEFCEQCHNRALPFLHS